MPDTPTNALRSTEDKEDKWVHVESSADQIDDKKSSKQPSAQDEAPSTPKKAVVDPGLINGPPLTPREKKMQEYIASLQKENVDLRSKFQHALGVLASRDMKQGSAPEWSNGQDCARCKSCFDIFTRRHHCRNCGFSVCSACSNHALPLPRLGFNMPVRVCGYCYMCLTKHIRTQPVFELFSGHSAASTMLHSPKPRRNTWGSSSPGRRGSPHRTPGRTPKKTPQRKMPVRACSANTPKRTPRKALRENPSDNHPQKSGQKSPKRKATPYAYVSPVKKRKQLLDAGIKDLLNIM